LKYFSCDIRRQRNSYEKLPYLDPLRTHTASLYRNEVKQLISPLDTPDIRNKPSFEFSFISLTRKKTKKEKRAREWRTRGFWYQV